MQPTLKSLLIAAAATVAPFGAAAQSPTEAPDTVKVLSNVETLTVITNGNTTAITVRLASPENEVNEYNYNVSVEQPDGDGGWNLNLPIIGDTRLHSSPQEREAYRKAYPHGPATTTTAMSGLYWGWHFGYGGGSNQLDNGMEVGFLSVLGQQWRLGRHGTSFHIGVGVGASRYHARAGRMLYNANDRLSQESVDGIFDMKKAKLEVFTFHVPLTLTQKIAGDFALSAGAVINFNTYGRVTDEWKAGHYTNKATMLSVRQRLLTADLIANLGFTDSFGIYARWSPVSIFTDAHGPVFRSWSLGASFNF